MKRNSGLQKRWLRNTLSILFAIVLLCVIALSIMVAAYYYSSMEAGMEAKARTSTSFFDNYVRQSYNEYYQSCAKFAQSFDSKDQMELQFVNTNNRIVASSYGVYSGMAGVTSDIREAIETKAIASYTGTNPATGERIMAVSSPLIYTNGEVIGVLRYVTSLRRADRQIMLFSLCAALVGLIVLLVVYVSGRYFVKSILVPVQELTATAKRISAGSYGVQIPRKSDDEIGELTDTINEMSEKISRAEKMQSEFVSSVSHELRTPLTNIRSYAETIRDAGDELPRELENSFLDIVINESDRMTHIVQDLLTLSRLDSGRSEMNMARFDFGAAIDSVLRSIELEARRHGHELTHDYHDLPMIMGDRGRIEQVMLNVLGNAVRYTPDGGHIRVTAGTVGERVWMEVADDGIGIPKADRSRIFERFYRVDKARSRESGGTGLGLSIATEIVQRHNGTLSLVDREGPGTTVRLELPIRQSEVGGAQEGGNG